MEAYKTAYLQTNIICGICLRPTADAELQSGDRFESFDNRSGLRSNPGAVVKESDCTSKMWTAGRPTGHSRPRY
jgi:hypothetical protein